MSRGHWCGMARGVLAGQALPDGVLMFFGGRWAAAVQGRRGIVFSDGQSPRLPMLMRVPVLRGIVVVSAQLWISMRAMAFSAQAADEDEDFGSWAVVLALTLSVALALTLFKFLPFLLAGFIASRQDALLFNIADGLLRATILLAYLAAIARTADARRLFSYHGAEHKVINSYEASGRLTLAGSRRASRFHARCSTSFLVVVLVLAIFLLALVPLSLPTWQVLLARLAMLVPIIGVSYEVIQMVARRDGAFARALLWPGTLVQRISTAEPDDAQLRVALAAARRVLPR